MRSANAFTAFLAILFAAAAFGAPQDVVITNPEVWSNVNANNMIRITTPGQTIINDQGCKEPDSYWVLSTVPKEAQARIFAALLAAKAMGRPITLRLDGCESDRPAILNVYFQ